ncbi:MAG: beta-glucoside-specific PTS transporter subunit IIABC [Lactobacillales bacterium]|nr:beta-glucoside-specific PTS transporter subunit IIABC [Lactobacillales bacterium]
MNNKEFASKIIELVGGEKNILSLTHCVTRLRFVLKNNQLVDEQKLSNLDGVMGIQKQAGQFQVIIGSKVKKVYHEVMNLLPNQSEKEEVKSQEKVNIFSRIVNTLSAILVPSLPPIIGGGMLKGLMYLFVTLKMLNPESGTYFILNITCDSMFYFFPFLIAASAAKRFNTNEYMAMALAGALLYPSMVNAALAGEMKSVRFLNLVNIPVINYAQSIVPILLGVLVMKYVYNFLEEKLPSMTTAILAPLFTLLTVVPIMLFAIAPLGFEIGEVVARGLQGLIDFSPFLSGLVIGTLRPFMVLVGMHHALRPIVQQQIASYGYSSMAAFSYLSTMAQATAPFAMFLILKNKKMKQIAISSSLSGFLGITEPALYGVLVKYKAAFIGASLGGGLGSAFASSLHARAFASAMPSVLSIPVYLGKGSTLGFLVGLAVTLVSTFTLTTLLATTVFRKDLLEDKSENEKTNNNKLAQGTCEIHSPVQGELLQLSEVPDDTFANQLLGRTIAIMPTDEKIVSPIDGEVEFVFDTKHAIGLVGKNGEEILIHLGIDTVALKGQYFENFVKKGDKVKAGECIAKFEIEKVKAAGFNPTVLTVVTNDKNYLSIIDEFEEGKIFPNEKIMNIVY